MTYEDLFDDVTPSPDDWVDAVAGRGLPVKVHLGTAAAGYLSRFPSPEPSPEEELERITNWISNCVDTDLTHPLTLVKIAFMAFQAREISRDRVVSLEGVPEHLQAKAEALAVAHPDLVGFARNLFDLATEGDDEEAKELFDWFTTTHGEPVGDPQ